MPFEVPENWEWTTLGEIGTWQSGATPSRMRKDYYGGNIPWLKTGDLNDGLITDIPEFITQKALDETSVKLNPIGSILIAMYGATIGKIGILTFPATTNQACCACSDYKIEQMYLFYFLLATKEAFITMGGGGAQPNISKEKITVTFMPLPPLTEQQRIVAAIEHSFKLIDTIEQGKDDLQTTIKQTKNKILDLAIHGKLVPQDPNDEPASELLKRINPKAEITCDNGHSEKLPKGWYLSTLGDCFKWGSGGTPESTVKAYYEGNIPWLVIGDLNDSIVTFASKHISQLGIHNSSAKVLTKGTLLMAMYGSIGKLGIAGMELATNQAIAYAKPNEINTYYLFYYLLANRDNFYMLGKGGTQKNISQTVIKSYPFLLPPLAEQKRIVLKIEELFSIIDTVEQTLQA